MDLSLYLSCFGITFFICDASILKPIRNWLIVQSSFLEDLFSCYFCTGFQVALWILVFSSDSSSELMPQVWFILKHAFAMAGFTYGLNVLILALERHNANSA